MRTLPKCSTAEVCIHVSMYMGTHNTHNTHTCARTLIYTDTLFISPRALYFHKIKIQNLGLRSRGKEDFNIEGKL